MHSFRVDSGIAQTVIHGSLRLDGRIPVLLRETGDRLLVVLEPRYFLKICVKTGQLLEVKNLTDQLQFRQYRSDACTLWEDEKELDYLVQCRKLMRKATPTDTELALLEGLWLEAHPKNHAFWLANHACIREDTVRWLLSPDRIPNRNILLPLWFGEIVKGMTLGTPDVVELCAGELEKFERYTAI